MVLSFSVLARKYPKEGNDERDYQERLHVFVWLASADRLNAILVHVGACYITKEKIQSLRLS